MNNAGIKRILVALDARMPMHDALLSAAMLASQLHAELQALFVEDINLLRLAELPFAREMVFGSREGRSINLAAMERQIQQQSARLRSTVEKLAAQQQIKLEFRILRGQIRNELCLATQQTDLLILGKSGTTRSQPGQRLGQLTQELLATVNCNVLLLQHGVNIDRPVAVMYDGSDASRRALQLAIQLAHSDNNHLKIIYPSLDPEIQHQLLGEVSSELRARGIDAGHLLLQNNTSEALLQATTHMNIRALILEAEMQNFNPKTVNEFIQHSHIPVFMLQ